MGPPHNDSLSKYHNSQGIRYLGSCRIFQIHCSSHRLILAATSKEVFASKLNHDIGASFMDLGTYMEQGSRKFSAISRSWVGILMFRSSSFYCSDICHAFTGYNY